MYTHAQARSPINLVEGGVQKIGEERGIKCVGSFKLDDWEEAFEVASRESNIRKFVVFAPNVK